MRWARWEADRQALHVSPERKRRVDHAGVDFIHDLEEATPTAYLRRVRPSAALGGTVAGIAQRWGFASRPDSPHTSVPGTA